MQYQGSSISRTVVLVFLKAPEKGMVKTRLAAVIGRSTARDLYMNFVRDILAMVSRSGHPTKICFHPPHAETAVYQWIGHEYSFWPQTGENLGERMSGAFMKAFSEGYVRAVLIGTDMPDLPVSVVEEAFDALQRHPAVIGPAADGGYYLIGFTAGGFFREIFEGISWSAPSVFHQTVSKLKQRKASFHILPTWQDIDVWEDLEAFASRENSREIRAPFTREYLHSRKLLPRSGSNTRGGG